MTSCACSAFRDPLRSFQDVLRRCEAAERISLGLRSVATDRLSWRSVWSCTICRQLWACEYPFGEMQGGGPRCFYAIEAEDPTAWLESGPELTSGLRRRHEDQMFFETLSDDQGTGSCRHPGCLKPPITNSVFCKYHHFEMIRGYPYVA